MPNLLSWDAGDLQIHAIAACLLVNSSSMCDAVTQSSVSLVLLVICVCCCYCECMLVWVVSVGQQLSALLYTVRCTGT
mgnify:CR=1 FL=1